MRTDEYLCTMPVTPLQAQAIGETQHGLLITSMTTTLNGGFTVDAMTRFHRYRFWLSDLPVTVSLFEYVYFLVHGSSVSPDIERICKELSQEGYPF